MYVCILATKLRQYEVILNSNFFFSPCFIVCSFFYLNFVSSHLFLVLVFGLIYFLNFLDSFC